MEKGSLKADVLLIVTAIIWGSAFVAQRVGMEFVGPFLFNGLRFALGSLVLLPLIRLLRINGKTAAGDSPGLGGRAKVGAGLLAGIVLFAGASFQQMGIVYTTAGKAGFITGLYVILVPILGIYLGQRTSLGTWAGAILALWGLYLLSVTEALTISRGDLLVLISALFWGCHVLLIGRLSPLMNPLVLASVQFATCSALSLVTALVIETIRLEAIIQAAVPILYGGLLSVGIAYTLQVVAQRWAHPAHTSIILSLEGAFAALGGWLVLGEVLSLRGLVGCALMLAGMLLSQLYPIFRQKPEARSQKP